MECNPQIGKLVELSALSGVYDRSAAGWVYKPTYNLGSFSHNVALAERWLGIKQLLIFGPNNMQMLHDSSRTDMEI